MWIYHNKHVTQYELKCSLPFLALFSLTLVFLPVFYFITFHVPFHFVTQHPPLTRNDIAAHCSSADQCPLLVKSDGTAKMPTHYDAAANMTQFCSHFPTKGSAFILV